jgi:predicted dehydrogenase
MFGLLKTMNPLLENNLFRISRRSFLAKCSIAAAAMGLPLWFVQRNAALAADAATDAPGSSGPNDRPGIALIGCGGQGTYDALNASGYGDLLAVCDVNQEHLDAASQKFTRDGKSPDKYTDFQKVMERGDIHTIVQATPDHWHTLVNIAAAKAKKDVYGEKPLTLTVDEGRHVIKAVRHDRIVFQTGTQQRSDGRFRLACELVRNGRIGKLQEVNVFVPAGLREGPFQTGQMPPPTLDFDFWLGQAPQVEYMKERCGNTFRWWWDYAGGPVTDWGAHHNDIARWGIGQDGPISVEASVITGPIPGGFATPSEFSATLTWEHDITQTVKTTLDDTPFGGIVRPDGQRNGIKFTGSDGWIWVNRDGISASKKELLAEPLPNNAIHLEVSHNHMRNFFDCVRSRKDPVACIENGHRSAVIGHLIGIALRTGQKYNWDPKREKFTGANAKEGNVQLSRPMRSPYNYNFAV